VVTSDGKRGAGRRRVAKGFIKSLLPKGGKLRGKA